MSKFIKLALPTTGIESAFMATPLFRNSPESIVQLPDSDHGRNIAKIFDGLCKVEFTNEFLTLIESVTKYGNISKLRPLYTAHVCKMYVDSFEMGHDNYIPTMNFGQDDLELAKKRLSTFKSPVCINASAGRFHTNRDIQSHHLMMSPEKWKIIIDYLKQTGHDVLFFTSSRCHFPLENTIPMLDYNTREMCAMFRVSGLHIAIESGMFHGAVASGATCIQLVPYLNRPDKFWWPNFVYTADMWKYEKPRVATLIFEEADRIIANIEYFYKNINNKKL